MPSLNPIQLFTKWRLRYWGVWLARNVVCLALLFIGSGIVKVLLYNTQPGDLPDFWIIRILIAEIVCLVFLAISLICFLLGFILSLRQ